MTNSLLDQRFGWRWLLPTVAGSGVGLYGFSAEEETFWEAELARAHTSGGTEPVGLLLVDGDRCAPRGSPSPAELHVAQVVGVVAGRERAHYWRTILATEFPVVREYGLLPAANPRVVVPLDSPQHALAALCLHRPGRWVARVALWLAGRLATLGNVAVLRERVLFVAARDSDCRPRGLVEADLSERPPTAGMTYALYLGTADENRKTVVLPLGDTSPEVILKVAANPRSVASLEHEAAVLACLAESPVSEYVPKVASVLAAGATLTVCQEYRPRCRIGERRMRKEVTVFLARLSSINRRQVLLADALAQLPVSFDYRPSDDLVGACRALYARLITLGGDGVQLWLHRAHGDFTPWNSAWTEKGLFVFDWEQSRSQDLALGDAFSYVVAPARLLRQGASPRTTLSAALDLGNRVLAAAALSGPGSRVYMALWLLRRADQAACFGELIVFLERNWSCIHE